MSARHAHPRAPSPPTRAKSLSLAIAAMGLALFVPSAASAVPLAPTIQHVEIKAFAFTPARLEIDVGDSVEFTNRDFAPHTATGDAGAWKTTTIKNGTSARIAFPIAGTFAYHCAFHPQMKAVIVVGTK